MDTIQLVVMGISAVLSFTLEHAPKINMWWSKHVTRQQKQIYIAVMAVVITAVVTLLSCYTSISRMECIDWTLLLYSLVSFIGTHSLVKK